MSVDTNTWLSFNAVGLREDLVDMIWMVSPVNCPFSNNIAETKATNTEHDWQTDVLDTVSSTNAQLQGQAFAANAVTATTRLKNYTQISGKYIQIARTLLDTIQAGAPDPFDYQIVKATKGLKRDMEAVLLSNNTPTAAASSTAPLLRGLPGWYSTNVVADGSANGTATAGRTSESSTTAITEANVKTVLEDIYTSSEEEIDAIMVSPTNKQLFSAFAGPTGTYKVNQADEDTLSTAIDVYRSDFGRHAVIPNRFQRGRDVHFLNWDYWAKAMLSPMKVQILPIDGDSVRCQLIAEYTLEARNEASSGLLADTTG